MPVDLQKQNSPVGAIFAAVLLLGAVAAGVYWFKFREPGPAPAPEVTEKKADAGDLPSPVKPKDDFVPLPPPPPDAPKKKPVVVASDSDTEPEKAPEETPDEVIPPVPLTGGSGKVVYTKHESSVDGKPFMVRGIYGVGMKDMERAAGYGFNVVQVYGLDKGTDENARKYLDAAKKHKLRVLFTLGMAGSPSPEKLATMRRRIETLKNHPALYAWYLADEPSVKSIPVEELTDIYKWIKKTDPNHPVFSSNWELGNFKGACDVDMRQVYNGPASGLRAGALPGHGKSADKAGVAWIAIANTYDSGWGQSKLNLPAEGLAGADLDAGKKKELVELSDLPPVEAMRLNPYQFMNRTRKGSPAEAAMKERYRLIAENLANPPFPATVAFPDSAVKLRGQAFDMIAHGSNGLFYWLLSEENSINPRFGYYTIFVRPELRKALTAVMNETDELWPRLANPAVGSHTWYEEKKQKPANVFYWSRRNGGEVTVIAVNESKVDNHEATTIIPELRRFSDCTVTVSGEPGRKVKIQYGKLTDTYKADEARVYLIKLSALDAQTK